MERERGCFFCLWNARAVAAGSFYKLMGKLLNVTSSVANSRVNVEYGRAQLGLDSRAEIVIIIQTNSLIAETRMTSPQMHV